MLNKRSNSDKNISKRIHSKIADKVDILKKNHSCNNITTLKLKLKLISSYETGSQVRNLELKHINTNLLPITNESNEIDFTWVRRDINGIEINKSNKNKIHVSFCDVKKKPLVEIINVESYKKMNYLLFIGFAESKFGIDCDIKNEKAGGNKDIKKELLKERRRKINELIINQKNEKEIVCCSCFIF